MAKAASREGVANDLKPVDYKKGLNLIQNRIKAKKDHVSSTNGEISGLWDEVEKLGINKKGARIFMSLDGLELSERNDILRTLDNLSVAAGWGPEADMVDAAEGKAGVEMPKPAPAAKPTPPPRGKPKLAAVPSGGTPDPEEAIEPATAKADIVALLRETDEELDDAEAYVIANKVFDERDTTRALTRKYAAELAQAEIDSWPEETETKQ
jgi:hypothetical protein